jgi:alpha-L-rhamnosidase
MKFQLKDRFYTFVLLLVFSLTAMGKVGFGRLTIEGRLSPEGLDEALPRFGWQLQSDKKKVVQQSYRILVSTSKQRLERDEGEIWDSRCTVSDRSQQVVYGGRPLQPNTTYYWKVQVTTNKGTTGWSETAHWSTGLMDDKNWVGQWIGTDSLGEHDHDGKFSRCTGRYFRKEFNSHGSVKRAFVHVSGLGYYALWINGERVGTDRLTPAPTDFTCSVAYNSYDVTWLIGSRNAIGAVVSAGYYFAPRQKFQTNVRTTYGLPRLRLDLIIEYVDGRRETIATDPTWKMNVEGPLRYSNLYDGEMYDSRLEFDRWTRAGFNDSAWQQATLCREPGGVMRGNVTEPIRVYETNRPVSLRRIGNRYLIDFGTNSAGVVRLRVHGNKGDTIRIRHAELLQKNGTELYTENLRSAEATAWYVSDGTEKIWQPEFCWFGFRYVEVAGVKNLEADDVERLLLSDNLDRTGNSIRFLESDTLNLIMEAAYRGIRSNYKGLPMDCPQRDERMPWTGDRTTGCLGESFTLDVQPLYAKWLQDISESQRPNGALSDVMPAYWRLYNSNITWPAVLPFACEMLLRQYGDDRPIRRHYTTIDRWLRYVKGKSGKDGLITYDRYGDWCVPPESIDMVLTKDSARMTDGQLISSCYYYYLCNRMAGYARFTHNTANQAYYEQEAKITRQAINKTFLHGNSYANSTVTANLMPLAMGVVPEDKAEAVKATLLHTIVETNNYQQSCGVVGIQWLMRYLSSIGRGDLSWRIATNTEYPSWGYMVRNGATTIWELWNGNTANPSMNSGNHVMLLGDLLPWAYETMGGISSSMDRPGFKHIIMAPDFSVNQCPGVKASHQSPYGLIESSWHREGQMILWNVTIPANTTAELHLPNGRKKMLGSGHYRLKIKP